MKRYDVVLYKEDGYARATIKESATGKFILFSEIQHLLEKNDTLRVTREGRENGDNQSV